MKRLVYPDAISLNHAFSGTEVSFRLDPLHLFQHLTEESAQLLVVIYTDIGLFITLNHLNNIVRLTLLVYPVGNGRTAPHVRLFNILARENSGRLSHKAIAHIIVIFCFCRFIRRDKAYLLHLRVHHEVQCEEIGPHLLQG